MSPRSGSRFRSSCRGCKSGLRVHPESCEHRSTDCGDRALRHHLDVCPFTVDRKPRARHCQPVVARFCTPSPSLAIGDQLRCLVEVGRREDQHSNPCPPDERDIGCDDRRLVVVREESGRSCDDEPATSFIDELGSDPRVRVAVCGVPLVLDQFRDRSHSLADLEIEVDERRSRICGEPWTQGRFTGSARPDEKDVRLMIHQPSIRLSWVNIPPRNPSATVPRNRSRFFLGDDARDPGTVARCPATHHSSRPACVHGCGVAAR